MGFHSLIFAPFVHECLVPFPPLPSQGGGFSLAFRRPPDPSARHRVEGWLRRTGSATVRMQLRRACGLPLRPSVSLSVCLGHCALTGCVLGRWGEELL